MITPQDKAEAGAEDYLLGSGRKGDPFWIGMTGLASIPARWKI